MPKEMILAAIGCTGEISEIFVRDLLDLGITLKLLARSPERVKAQYPAAQIIAGSMTNVDDVACVMEGTDAAFLTTPIGPRNDTSIEAQTARVAIEAAQRVGLPHLIYVSVIGIDSPTGVPLLDSKRTVEKMLSESGVPWTAIRCGSYIEDVVDRTLPTLKRGFYLFPVTPSRKFNYTLQGDVPLLVKKLLEERKPLNGSLDFIEPNTYSVRKVAQLMSRAAQRRIRPSGKFPLYLLTLAQPFLYLRKHRMSTIIPLIRYFNRNGYQGNTHQLLEVYPDFKMTTLEEHLRRILA